MRCEKGRQQRLSVFKGREAKLNRAIFQTLALHGPQTIYDIHKRIRTTREFRSVKYASINKRVRALRESDYLRIAGTKVTQAGPETSLHELAIKAYLATFLSSITMEDLLSKLVKADAEEILERLQISAK